MTETYEEQKENLMKERLQAKYIEKMQECVESEEAEGAHRYADYLLCELLRELGYNELIDKYDKVEMWHA